MTSEPLDPLMVWLTTPAHLSSLMAIARLQLKTAGDIPTPSAVYARVRRLRRDELTARVRGQAWTPLPPTDLAAIDRQLQQQGDTDD